MTEELFALLSSEAAGRIPRHPGDRWLVVISARESSCLEAYRYIYSELRLSLHFKKTLMVFGDGRVEPLAE
jgi:hypothetical protein